MKPSERPINGSWTCAATLAAAGPPSRLCRMMKNELIATGKTIKEISAGLDLSEKTVATYRSRIAEKMNLSTNVELTRYAMQHGLVD